MRRITSKLRLALAAGCALACSSVPARADYVVAVDPNEARGTWEGFGASLSWWANAVGGTPYEQTYIDLFFGTNPVQVNGVAVPALGMNIARYNVGGGGKPGDIAGVPEAMPSTVPWAKDIDGFQVNWNDPSPTSASWDWSRDARQRGILSKLQANGVNVEFFANAPMWWMTYEKSSAGGRLQEWNRRDHARYLATVVKQARTQWGVNVKSLEPFNEPLAGWWNYPVGQEGLNLSVAEQAEILGYLRNELDAQGLSDVSIAASDENAMSQAVSGYQALSGIAVPVGSGTESAASLIGKVNVHGYAGLEPWRDDSVRTALRQTVGDKRIWLSEYGDNDGSGLKLAQSIVADINYLRPTAWVYWQPVEPYSPWGFLNGQYSAPEDETSPTRGSIWWLYSKHYVFAQFSRFLRPGYKVIGNSDGRSITAYDAASKKLVMITLNEGPAQTITYDLTKFSGITATSATVTTTTFDGASLMANRTSALGSKQLALAVPANSIQSIVIDGVTQDQLAEPMLSSVTGQCIDLMAGATAAATQLVQSTCASVDRQRWTPVRNGSFYSFRNSKTGMCMNVNGGSRSAGARIIQWYCGGATNEQFEMRKQGQGYAFVARHSGLCVGVQNASTAVGAGLTQQTCNGSPSQTWYVPLGSKTLQTSGTYLCLDIPGGVLTSGQVADQWQCVGSNNQRWNVLPASIGYSTFQSVNSNHCLSVLADRRDAGAPVGQATCVAGALNQQFEQRPQNDGFALVARSSGLCLVPDNNSRVWGTQVVQQPCTGSAFQTWR